MIKVERSKGAGIRYCLKLNNYMIKANGFALAFRFYDDQRPRYVYLPFHNQYL